ncbi:MAG TPA: endonuclease/exonuclease/phosphatase family protein [Nocardioides sp.]|uniref:endonuclease/exonuclease/phosphatase family protein n=1 Tax=Nocardioides sp. TaxID=35761 RepID=UPI002D7F5BC1|nr:endonuclease/exonuclease/phosphatase family protein [Nocardioides sp.]HET6651228.1 endonuclease/exonuclease/phosphatase family protein [Nocardioides sp.]
MSTLTVATYNVYLGADLALLFDATSLEELAERAWVVEQQLVATDFAQRATAIARILAREEVDVVGLQEVTRWESDGDLVVDFLPLVVQACEQAGAPYDVHAANQSFAGGLPVDGRWMSIAGADAVLVRGGGRFTVTGEGTASYSRSLDMRTGIDGVTFPIVRGWGRVDGEADGRRVLFATTHTEAYDAAVREAQREELLDALGDPGCPAVVVGDFNARPEEAGVRPPYRDAWLAAGNDPDAGYTCGQAAELDNDASSLSERIDYVFVRDADVVDCSVVGDQETDRTEPGRLWPSDHAGVVARLEF